MDNALHEALAGWDSFYLIAGTAAAALTGLQFVVQSLLASDLSQAVHAGDPEGGISAFGTPTVVHFTLSLVVSSVMCVPWSSPVGLRETLAVLGTGALVYSAVVLRRARRQRGYAPVVEDWIWHVVLPVVAYGAVLFAGFFLGHGTAAALFAVGGATLLLLCVGIHNAWDTVTYLTVTTLRTGPADQAPPPRPHAAGRRGRRRR